MKPKACANCNTTFWIQDNQKRNVVYCKKCEATALRVSNIITRRKKEKAATEKLDLDEVRRQREWL